MTSIDLTRFANLIQAEQAADDARRFHESEAAKYKRVRDEYRVELEKRMGTHDVALVNGKEVLRRTLSRQFADARFRDAHPDIWEQYKVPRLEYVLNMDKLREELPQLVAEFSSNRWTNNYEVLS